MHVLISGAGIAGSTLAWWLSKTGAQVTVLEKNRVTLGQGQNIDIGDSAVAVIEKMGLLGRVRGLNTTEKGTVFIDPRGRSFAPFPVREGSKSFTSEFEILRGDLAMILYEHTKDLPGVNYRFGVTIQEVLQNSAEAVKVRLSNGEELQYDLLVAADGQWSIVRKLCFPPEVTYVLDKNLYCAYYTIPRQADDNEYWKIYHAVNSRVASLRPDPHGTMRCCITHMPSTEEQKALWQKLCRSGDRQAQEDLIKRTFAGAGWQMPRFLDAMERTQDFYVQAVQQIRMSQWSTGRVVCLGDAAHAPTPLTGMGTSLAIQGAYTLAGELSTLGEGEDLSPALQAYETKFRPFVQKTQNLPSFVPAIAHPATWWRIWLLQTLVWVASGVFELSGRWGLFAGGSSGKKEDGYPLPQYTAFDEKVTVTGD